MMADGADGMAGARPAPAPGMVPGRKPGRLWSLEVVGGADIAPNWRRVSVTAADLEEMTYKPGQDLVLAMPLADGTTGRRHYTIRQIDLDQRRLDLDFVLHGSSPAGDWARTAKRGDKIDAMGPRGRTVLNPDADWHLFAGDETCIPGIFGMLEILSAGAKAWAFIEIADQAAEMPVKTQADLKLEWVLRNGAAPGPSRLLADRLATCQLPAGRGHLYLIGETSNVRTQRHELMARGIGKDQIAAEGYWRPGRIGGHDHIEERPA
jgi:NADPH-dependent ferric siderophore reductase